MNVSSVRLQTRVGILGGGQLARMLAEAALRLGLRPTVYASSPEEPTARSLGGGVFGHLDDETTLRGFLSGVEIVVFENEFVRGDVLRRAAGARAEALFVPSLDRLERLRDKSRQKERLEALGIPTARWSRFRPEEDSDWKGWLKRAHAELGPELVIKWGELGYDGKGVFVASEHASDETARDAFVATALAGGVALYAEEKVSFRRELAVVGCLSVNGEFRAYPLVVSEQARGICRRVTGPAVALGLARATEERAQKAAEALARAEGLFGCFAIEFFETARGELVVNEIAPRVHNSGHYTQDAAATSQFENHWRAVLGMPLGETTAAPGFAMLNLLGPPGARARASELPVPPLSPRGHLHWYDKAELRPGRKLGHWNGRVERPEELASLVAELEASEKAWREAVRRISTGKRETQ